MFLQPPTLLLGLTATLCLSWLLTFRRLVARARAEDLARESEAAASSSPPLSSPFPGRTLLRAQAYVWAQRYRPELALALETLGPGIISPDGTSGLHSNVLVPIVWTDER